MPLALLQEAQSSVASRTACRGARSTSTIGLILLLISPNSFARRSDVPTRTTIASVIFKEECEKIEKIPKSAGPEGLRILMPRALSFLYTLRNKRDIGHVGGDVDANEIDALTATRVADWCVCELVRVCHGLPLEDAQILCDALAERRLPKVWEILGRKRVLDTSLGYRDQTLLLLYSEIDIGIATEDLFEWTEHSHKNNFRRDILAKLHRARLVEWDHETEMAVISPKGIQEVERRIFPRSNRLPRSSGTASRRFGDRSPNPAFSALAREAPLADLQQGARVYCVT